MKKSLFALAAVTAFAGAAQAQSSVTVYGILDAGFSGTSTRGATSAYTTGQPITAAANNTKVTNNTIGSGYDSTSRLGFKGTEDLGGGTSAFFTVEMGLAPTGSTQFTTMTNRQSFVGVAKKGLGNVAVGTQYTPIFNSMTATNPGANNTVMGSMIYPQTSASSTNSEALTVRVSNALTVNTDTFAGFSAQGIYYVNNNNQTQTGASYSATTVAGNTNASGYGIGLNYNWQKLLVTAAMQSNTVETDAVVSNTAATTVTTIANNQKDGQYYVGATYDFGILKAYASYINRKVTSGVNSNVYFKRAGEQIGVRSFITPTIEAWAQGGLGKYTAAGSGEPTANFNTWQLGANYYLSKRSNLYAIYGQSLTSSSINTANVTTSAAGSQYAIGLRHTF